MLTFVFFFTIVVQIVINQQKLPKQNLDFHSIFTSFQNTGNKHIFVNYSCNTKRPHFVKYTCRVTVLST